MAIEGSLDLFRLPEILQVVSQESKTGILTVQGEQDIVAISFSKGRVVAADALNRTLEDALGVTLDREGLLAREEYEAALAEQRSQGGRLIDVLVDRGYLDRSELLLGLRRYTSDLLADILLWDEGDFKFYTNDEVSYEEGFDPISIDSLLLANLDRQPEPEPEPVSGDVLPAISGEASPLPDLGAGETPAAAETPAEAPRLDELTVPEITPERPTQPAPEPEPQPQPVAAPRAEPRPEPQPRVERAATPRSAPRRPETPAWIPRILGLAAGLAVVTAWIVLPASRLLLPLPWSEPVRGVLDGARQRAAIDRAVEAVHTFHLLEGRLPNDLQRVTERDLLPPYAPTEDRALDYRPDTDEFTLALGDAVVEHPLRGDFLLDADFLLGSGGLREPPLVLLD